MDPLIELAPPTPGILGMNALAADDAVLILVATNYLSLRGLQLLLRSIQMIQAQIHPDLQILGILGCCMTDGLPIMAKGCRNCGSCSHPKAFGSLRA